MIRISTSPQAAAHAIRNHPLATDTAQDFGVAADSRFVDLADHRAVKHELRFEAKKSIHA
jgi:hypothetical protein